VKIGIIGATGLVGRTVIKVLEEENLSISELRLFASNESLNDTISFLNKKLPIEALCTEKISTKFDFLFFCSNSEISETFAPEAVKNGTIAIDNSRAFRKVDNVPLIIPEINGYLIKDYQGIIANPNCSTIQMLKAIYPIYAQYGISEIVISTYQAVSGAGLEGILTLNREVKGLYGGDIFKKEIFENVIPMIGSLDENGFSEEENKLIFESKKILANSSIRIFPTAVRVPVVVGHSEAIFLRTDREIDLEEIKRLYSDRREIIYSDELITPKDSEGRNKTFVSRLRKVGKNELMMWVVADNLRVGAAYNAVNILKSILFGG